ncbi:hypothetical protein CDAR_115621 [Caerostris darwini]|uniref:Uncharacterized protein n=1 Tax=Caerostris darwini TaxID=1538125 RepID=A0AAV4M4Y4_9ARAC|nr:hypothetical protein CDAR_115621 [Caerostris darwini]
MGTKLLHAARHAKHHVSHVLPSRLTASNDTCSITHGDLSQTTFSLKGAPEFPVSINYLTGNRTINNTKSLLTILKWWHMATHRLSSYTHVCIGFF